MLNRAQQQGQDLRRSSANRIRLGVLRALLASLLLILVALPVATRAAQPVVVLYPDLGEPYRSIFISIISGIEAELESSPLLIAVDRSTPAPRIMERIRAFEGRAVIALGRSSVELIESADPQLPVVRGAVVEYPDPTENGRLGISLIPDPGRLFVQLQELAPQVKSVNVIYSQPQVASLIDQAEQEAGRLGLDFRAQKVDDLMSAASAYRAMVAGLGRQDALWVVQDPQAVDEKVILPMLLNQAWENGFILFSSYAEHAKRGALFSVYPDNFGMGRRLAKLAVAAMEGHSNQASIRTLQDLFVAVNLRAAEHSGLNISPDQLRNFDLTFPQR